MPVDLGQAFDAKRVDHDVLGRGHRRHQQRAERHEQRRARRIGQRQQQDRDDQQQLREHQPAAPAAERSREERHMQRIDQRRPQEFQRVGRADQREQADGPEIDAGFAHPHQQRRPRQRQRQPGGKAEQHHNQHPPLQIHRKAIAPRGARRGEMFSRGGRGFRCSHEKMLADSDGNK
jgi:hypothetical protein